MLLPGGDEVMRRFFLCVFLAISVTSWAQDQPTIKITTPAEGATVPGPDVTIQMEALGVTIKAADGTRTPNEGHYHLYLDTEPQLTPETPIGQEAVHTAQNSYTFKGLTPGKHTVTVVLADGQHIPFDPSVTAKVSFTVAAAEPNLWLVIGVAFVAVALLLIVLQMTRRPKPSS
jgi:hypothetical protein